MFRKRMLAVSALLLLAGVARAAAPAVITYSGFLLDSAGSPLTAPTQLTFRFYGAADGGFQLGSESITVVPSSEGYFSAVVGTGYVGGAYSPPSFAGLFQSQAFMSVQVEGDSAEMTPRIQITSMPSALSVDWSGITGRPESSCSGTTPFATGIDADGRVICGAAPAGVTSVSGAAPIAVSPGTTPQVSLAGCSSADQVLKWNGSAWTCATGSTGTITGVSVVAPLVGGGTSGTVSIALPSCPTGQLLKMGATGWGCAADLNGGGTVTSVSAVAPIAVTNGTTTPVLSMSAASSSANGYLSSADWNAFSGKLSAVSHGTSLSGDGTAGSPLAIPTGGVTSAMIADGTVAFADWASNGCTAGQIPKWNGFSWVCSGDYSSGGTVTSVQAGSGLVSNPPGGITTVGELALDPTASPTFNNLTIDGAVNVAGDVSVGGALNIGWERVWSLSSTAILTLACPNYGGADCYSTTASATCSTGKRLLGGGCATGGVQNTPVSVNVYTSFPSDSSWWCGVNGLQSSLLVYAYAICARVQ